MKGKHVLAMVLGSAVMMTHAGRAQADFGDAVGGLIVGAIVGNAIASQRRGTRSSGGSGISSAARQLARDVQTALNHFNYPVGNPDGVLGPQSRGAISQYQAYLSFPPTGNLTDFERQVLLTAYQRSLAGGVQVVRITSSHRDGIRGLLGVVRDEMMGSPSRIASAGAYGLPGVVADAVDEIAASSDPSAEQLVNRAGFVQLSDLNGDGRTDYILDTSVTGSAFWCNAQACTVQVFVSTPDGYSRNDFQTNNAVPASFDCLRSSCVLIADPETTVVSVASAAQGTLAAPVPSAVPMVQNPGAATGATVTGAVPNFFPTARATAVSLSSHCNRVMIDASRNGFTDINTMVDPQVILNEQFCLARGHAITEGESLIAQVPGATADSIAQQCDGFAALVQPHVAALAVQPREAVLQGVLQFSLNSGLSTTDLASTARICLSSGYQTDRLGTALGAALVLTSLGETAYGELPAHHLMQGIGAPVRPDPAAEWFRASLPAPGVTTLAVGFAPGQVSRNALILSAVDMVSGGAPARAPVLQAFPQIVPQIVPAPAPVEAPSK